MTNRQDDYWRIKIAELEQSVKDKDAAIGSLLRSSKALQDMSIAHGAAIRMVRDAIEILFGPTASLESEEAVLLRGPEPHHDAEAIIEALQRVKDMQRSMVLTHLALFGKPPSKGEGQ